MMSKKSFVAQVFKGRSLLRIMQNICVEGTPLIGKILDLGGGPRSQYYEYFDISRVETLHYADLYQVTDDHLIFDFESEFPIDESTYDTILLMNVFEHIFRSDVVLTESYRVLKPGGRMLGVVPFLYPIHGVPNDFWRPTKMALEKSLIDAGFSSVQISETGHGKQLVIANLLARSLCFKPLTLLWYAVARIVDSLGNQIDRRNYPLGYIFVAEKET